MGIVLALTPEFGGQKFGPFDATSIALGSDADQCHIALSQDLGIYPVHTWLAQNGSNWIIQPADARARVFLYRGGRGPSINVTTATTIANGDRFALATEQGVQFVLEIAASSAQTRNEHNRPGSRGGRRPPTAQDMGNEIKRQIGVSVMTSGPGAKANHFLYRLKSGAYFQPRYIVGALIAVGGMLMTGCSGLLVAISQFL